MFTVKWHKKIYKWCIPVPVYTLSTDLDIEMRRELKEDPQGQHGDPSKYKHEMLKKQIKGM